MSYTRSCAYSRPMWRPSPIITASDITRPLVRSMLARIFAASTSSPSRTKRVCFSAPAIRQNASGSDDPLDLPRPGRALVVGDHRVHQRRRMLAHHRDGRVDVARRDRIALLRHRAARAAAVRERLVHLRRPRSASSASRPSRSCRACRRRARGSSRPRRWCRAPCARRSPAGPGRARPSGPPASPSRRCSIDASVPQAPPNSPTSTRGFNCARRSRWRSTAARIVAIL